MRRLISTLTLTASLALAAPALAKSSQKFESNLQTPISAVNVKIMISDDLAWRGDNLPKDRRDRGQTIGLNNGFSGNGFYGDNDLNRLAERLERRMEERLLKSGINVSDDAAQTLQITLTDARPNRPTQRQLSKQSSLSMQSFSRGGAAFEGELVSSTGETLGNLSYARYDSDIHEAQFGSTWSGANRAIDWFAKKTAKTLD